ncbi:hypothetical protein ACRQET_06605, partial [Actinotignum sp. GS-2025c]|uniref:hypothetical protein n=1 Tax=Actinotignum sp. GS-2025c TaxID=3427276 RepID=UPI003F47D1F9
FLIRAAPAALGLKARPRRASIGRVGKVKKKLLTVAGALLCSLALASCSSSPSDNPSSDPSSSGPGSCSVESNAPGC